MDNLYLRLAFTGKPNIRPWGYISLASFAPLHWPLRGQGRRYVTRTTLQGDGAGPGVGVWAEEDTYIESVPQPMHIAACRLSYVHCFFRDAPASDPCYAKNFCFVGVVHVRGCHHDRSAASSAS